MSDLSHGASLLHATLAAFTSDTRLYAIDTPLGKDVLLVESFVGREALSTLYEVHVDCLATDTHIELKSLLGKQAVLHTRLADGSRHPRSGYITAIAQPGTDGGLARYRLTLMPWLALAQHQRRSRVFQDVTLPELIDAVLAAYRPYSNWSMTPDAEAFLADLRPRSYCCQYRESDYAFLSRILAEEGIGFYFEETPADNMDVSQQRLVLFADSTAFADDPSAAAQGGIRFHRNASIEQYDTIQAFSPHRRLQAATTTIGSWDYQAKRVTATALPTAHAFGGEQAPRIESYDWSGTYAFANLDEAERTARILREAADARFKQWTGEGAVRSFRPGSVFTLTASPLDELADLGAPQVQRRFALLAVQHAGINNLPADLTATLATRLRPLVEDDSDDWHTLRNAATATGYANRFTAIRADIPWRPTLHDGTGTHLNPKPTAYGSQTAIVVGPDGSTANAGTVHTDHLGRIRIRYHWQQEESNTCWVRVLQLHAGPGYGAQFIPRIGQEVLLKFLDNDIDRPVVAGVLYNGQGQDDASVFARAGDHARAGQDNKNADGNSPAWHGAAAEHRHAGYLSGFKSVALGVDGYTRQSNQLAFDDSTGRLRTQLATDAAATQLNLGHLIHQADNYRGSFRGTGWELRTDAYGAIRAGKGILLSTYLGGRPDGQPEPAGENTPGIALLKQVKGFAENFNRAAATHQTVQFILVKGHAHNGAKSQSRLDDTQTPIDAMLKAISGMVDAQDGSIDGHGEKIPHMHAPMVIVTAQAGIGVTASEGLHIASGEVAHFASGRDTHLAVGEALSLHSGQAIGLLAGAVSAGDDHAGIKLIAAQDDVEFQAQSSELTFAAKEAVKLASVNSHVEFAAAQSITLCTEGGASLTIEGRNITFACPGTVSIKSASKSFTGPTKLHRDLPPLPKLATENSFSQRLNVSHVIGFAPGEDEVLERVPYEIRSQHGKLLGAGRLDEKGTTQRVITNRNEQLTVWIGDGHWQIFGDRDHS
ncbi:MAG TPA: type VI secretion system Vgr family protein [Noviherbaspirillum sp.]|uniref:type VI secretion system Vgr family protein n=1 Tax=Noviherbaspirillum sp. TaxID=1926288 RepID=UPI002B469566|nr:type VI secretion system Vgr family protein [Noviherbaspirillum sp.]HJV87621.1 type VI secretion system Vgr family protein [Noviherbaspirillum sp.]